MVKSTAEIDPSPQDREAIREMLMSAFQAAKKLGDEAEIYIKENRKTLDGDQKAEAEAELQRHRRDSDTLEDVLSKCENTKGRTLKKVFAKKTLSVVCI
jgi:hypothetical protein